jgi:hypothetical protein
VSGGATAVGEKRWEFEEWMVAKKIASVTLQQHTNAFDELLLLSEFQRFPITESCEDHIIEQKK